MIWSAKYGLRDPNAGAQAWDSFTLLIKATTDAKSSEGDTVRKAFDKQFGVQGVFGHDNFSPDRHVGITETPSSWVWCAPASSSRSERSRDESGGSSIRDVLALIALRLRDSRFGQALRAIVGNEAAAAAFGVNVARYKLAAFVIAALYASCAGSLFTHFVGFISPEVFGTAVVVPSFTLLSLGGVGTTWGLLIDALIASLLPEVLRVFLPAGLKEMHDIAFAAILILIFAPRGLASLGALSRLAEAR